MDILFVTQAMAAGVFGAIIGSFLNALSFRYHTGAGMNGRSKCMRCGIQLRARDLIPIASYLLLRGRCRECGSRINIQYPLVEATAALLGFGTYLLHPELLPFAFTTLVWATLLFVVVYDLRHTVLPASALALLGALGFLSLLVQCGSTCTVSAPSLAALLAGPALGAPLLLLSLVSRGRWMGWGDGILAVGIGWLLGIPGGIFALLVAFWSGSIVGLALVAWSRVHLRKKAGYTHALTLASLRFISIILPLHITRQWYTQQLQEIATAKTRPKLVPGYTIQSAIPFAPFLALGALTAHVFHIDIFSVLIF